MTIETLIKALPPPAKPTYAFDGPWEPIEAELGTSLPQDYKNLVRLYGAGQYMKFFGVYEPVSPSPWGRLIPAVYQVQKVFVENYPYPMHPQPGGLLACGQTDNGDYIFWLTRGETWEWPIVVWDRGGDDDDGLETFECDLTDFIAGIAIGTIRPKAFPDLLDLPEGGHAFRSLADPWPENPTPA